VTKNLLTGYLLRFVRRPLANGWVQSHKDGVIVRYKANLTEFTPPTHAQLAEFEAKKKAQQRAKLIEYEKAAIVAREIASQARKITNPHEHPYLIAKGLKSAHNALILTNDLILPYWNENRELSTVQFIAPNFEKRFLKGGKKTGCFGFIGTPTQRILIAEGFATAASLHEDTGNFCIFAGDAGNLEPVAKVIRKLYPENQITICGDNDISGVGQAAAKKAAIACGGAWIVPSEAGKDFNDVISGGSE
jgi:putative DNA primase/helicase